MVKAIDLFAGMGGFTEGASLAGVKTVWAANHWQAAVEMHAMNHPETIHACQDLRQANFTAVPDHDILLASPACQGHTHARGKEKPHHDATRSTAWAVIDALEIKRPPVAIIENVPEFQKWALFPKWWECLEALGYNLTANVLDAADYGVPQNRERVFIVAHQGHAISVNLRKQPHVPASAFVDTSLHNNKWSRINKPGRAEATLRRIANGRKRFGDVFIAPYYGSGSGETGRSLDRPIGTISTVDGWSVINGGYMRMLTKEEYRAGMGFRDSYQLPQVKRPAVHMLGNAVCPPLVKRIVTHVLREAGMGDACRKAA